MSGTTRSIGDVCNVVGGGTPSRSTEAFFGGAIPWATVRDMKADWIDTTEFSLTEEGVRNSATNVLPSGTVVVASRVGLGKVCRIRNDTAINQDLRGFLPKRRDQLDEQYLFHWFRSVAHRIVAAGTGATVQGVTLPFLKALKIPLPPLEEQRRIVAVLDEALAAIVTATANAEKNLANARELFLESLRAELEGATGSLTTLGETTDIKVGFAFKSTGYSKDNEDVPLIRGDNVVQGRLRWDDVKRWPRRDLGQHEAYRLEAGDVLLAMDRTWVKAGLKYAILGPGDVPSLLVQRVARLRAKNVTSSGFVGLQIAAPEFTEYVLGIQTGLGVPHISGQQIADYRFRLPTLSEQSAIIERLNIVRSASSRLAGLYDERLRALDKLKQSLLHRAFPGNLTEREPLAA